MGKSIAERKEALAKEMRELEILENQEAQRNELAEKEALVNRLLLDLHNQKLACALPISSVAHVKMIYGNDTCNTCYFADTCSQIVSLTGKGAAKKGSRKSTGTRAVNSDNIKIEKDFSIPGEVTYKFAKDYVSFSYDNTGNDNGKWSAYKKALRETFPRKNAIAAGLTNGQYSGLMHRGSILRHLK